MRNGCKLAAAIAAYLLCSAIAWAQCPCENGQCPTTEAPNVQSVQSTLPQTYEADESNESYRGRPQYWQTVHPAGVAKSAVDILTIDRLVQGGGESSRGRGTIVSWRNRVFVVTAQHVLREARVSVWVYHSEWKCKAEILAQDPTWDVAVLGLDKGIEAKLKSKTWTEMADSIPPLGTPVSNWSMRSSNGRNVTLETTGLLIRKVSLDRRNFDGIEWSGALNDGDSGGGVFDSSGKLLIGLVTGTSGSLVDGPSTLRIIPVLDRAAGVIGVLEPIQEEPKQETPTKSASMIPAGLMEAYRNNPDLRVCASTASKELMEGAELCAKLLDRGGVSGYWQEGHPDWARRRLDLVYAMTPKGCNAVEEITAMATPYRYEDNPTAFWQEAIRCWRASPGHWSLASKRHKYYGAAGKGYFAVILGGD